MSYGSMLDYRELIKEAAKFFGRISQEELIADLREAYMETAKTSFLKLQVAGNVWLIRKAEGAKHEEESEAEIGWNPGAPVANMFNKVFGAQEEYGQGFTQSASIGQTAMFPGVQITSDKYIIEKRNPRDLFRFRFHRDSKQFPSSKPHACRFYGTTLRAVAKKGNKG